MEQSNKVERVRHKGRFRQIPIYLGKFFRMFIYLDDWKVLPMSAVIAGLVVFVGRRSMFNSMEGTLKGSLMLVCISLWNGCFNSIQVVCRERDVVKREHRNGMHISSYIIAHMIYQAFLCLLQTIITVMVCYVARMNMPEKGVVTPWFALDIGITFFVVAYASDMMSLLISSIAKTTTAAMTIMPFVLIFQLVFSSSMFGVSGNLTVLTNLSICKWGMTAVCAQSGYNDMPMTSVWDQLQKFNNVDLKDIQAFLNSGEGEADEYTQVINDALDITQTIYQLSLEESQLEASAADVGAAESTAENAVESTAVNTAESTAETVQAAESTVSTASAAEGTESEILMDPLNKIVLEDNTAEEEETEEGFKPIKVFTTYMKEHGLVDEFNHALGKQSANSDYDQDPKNVMNCWGMLIMFALIFALAATIYLEGIDKDKR